MNNQSNKNASPGGPDDGPAPQPWDRRPDEGASAYDAFICYRDMGSDRSIRTVAQKLGKSSTLISCWSSLHSWCARVDAWDGWVREEARREEYHAEVAERARWRARRDETRLAIYEVGRALLRRALTAAEGGADLLRAAAAAARAGEEITTKVFDASIEIDDDDEFNPFTASADEILDHLYEQSGDRRYQLQAEKIRYEQSQAEAAKQAAFQAARQAAQAAGGGGRPA